MREKTPRELSCELPVGKIPIGKRPVTAQTAITDHRLTAGGHFGKLLREHRLDFTGHDRDARFRFGKMAHYTKSDHAYIDFDFPRPDRRSPKLRPLWTVLRLVGLRPRAGIICMERTRRGWHVIVPLTEKLPDAEMIALQLCMGDDQRRGALNLMRVRGMRRKCYGVTPHWWRRSNILYGGKLL